MLFIYGHDLSPIDKEGLKMILGHAGIRDYEIRFVDLNHEDPDVEKRKCILCTGRSLKAVSSAIKETGAYTFAQLLGDVIDPDNNFMLFNIGIDVIQMISGSSEDKAFTWSKIQQVAQYYRQMVPFNDPLPEIESNPKVESPVQDVVPEQQDTPISTVSSEKTHLSTIGNTEEPQETAKEESTTEAKEVSTSEVVGNTGEININVMECLNALYEHVNLVDPGLGNSLSKYQKFTLHTSGGDMNVYPTNRLGKDDGFKITFKDLMLVLKASIQMNAGSITFESKSGTEVDS